MRERQDMRRDVLGSPRRCEGRGRDGGRIQNEGGTAIATFVRRRCLVDGARRLFAGERRWLWLARGRFRSTHGRSWNDAVSPSMARGNDAMEAKKWVPRWGHDGSKACQGLDGRHHALGHPMTTGSLDAVRDEAVAAQTQTRKRERRPRQVSAETLASKIVARIEVDTRVEIEALVSDGVAHARRIPPYCRHRTKK